MRGAQKVLVLVCLDARLPVLGVESLELINGELLDGRLDDADNVLVRLEIRAV